jgi:hypothetical protein
LESKNPKTRKKRSPIEPLGVQKSQNEEKEVTNGAPWCPKIPSPGKKVTNEAESKRLPLQHQQL